MAYTDEAVSAKLSALNETQESIVTVAQWVMFHRRHADRTAQLWLQRLKDTSSSKRLNLIYLANEVAQQSKARRKDDFLIAFQPVIAEALASAYKGAPSEVQNKLKRVVEVWRQRQIFEIPIQEAVEARIEELEKSRSTSRKPALGGSLFSSTSGPSAPAELQPLVPLQIALTKSSASKSTTVSTADTEYEKLTDPSKATPTPPVYAARLSALLKSLAAAEAAVSETLSNRRALLEGLEKLTAANKTALDEEEAQHVLLVERKQTTESKKRDVEDSIMRGLSAESTTPPGDPSFADSHINGRGSATPATPADVEPDRPDIEELTPPPMPVETSTTSDPPTAPAAPVDTNGAPHEPTDPTSMSYPPQVGADLLSSLNIPSIRQFAGSPDDESASKRRRVDDDESAVFGAGSAQDAIADLDEDVAEMIKQEAGEK